MVDLNAQQEAAHEPECSHLEHFCEANQNCLTSLVHVSPVTEPLECGMRKKVECQVLLGRKSVECRVWNVKRGMWNVKCKAWNVECEVRSVECGM